MKSKGATIQAIRDIEAKMMNHRMLVSHCNQSNLLANPEVRHMIFKSKKVLSVHHVV